MVHCEIISLDEGCGLFSLTKWNLGRVCCWLDAKLVNFENVSELSSELFTHETVEDEINSGIDEG